MKNKQRGFTLIELLVVVLIIGILAAVALPKYQLAVNVSRTRLGIALAEDILRAQEVYFLSNEEYADSLDKLDISFPTLEYYKADTMDMGGYGYRGFGVSVRGIGKVGANLPTINFFGKQCLPHLCHLRNQRYLICGDGVPQKVARALGATQDGTALYRWYLPSAS